MVEPAPVAQPPLGSDAQRAPIDPLAYVEDRNDLVPGNDVRLLRNGAEVFPAWLDAIRAARERISLEMYIFNDDTIGKRFGDALAAAAARGVTVRLLYDFIGCRDASPGFFPRLREAGVHVIAYHRYRMWRPRVWALFRRNHRKTLVCDGEVAFTGGLNIADEWLPLADGGGGWKDAAIEVRGPAVTALEAVFLQTWNRRSPRRLQVDPAALPRPAAAGAAPLVVVSNTELRERFAIRRAALHALRESRRRVLLANPYFVPDGGILRALCKAAARGVDVRVLVPEESDSLTLDFAARATFSRLLAAGVRIFQNHAVVHTKALVVDDVFASIGSYNLDHRSLAYNLEVVVNVIDSGLALAVGRMLDEDMTGGEEIRAEDFAQRSIFARLLEYLAYGLRRWL
jgi:cardiolipin synthase